MRAVVQELTNNVVSTCICKITIYIVSGANLGLDYWHRTTFIPLLHAQSHIRANLEIASLQF